MNLKSLSLSIFVLLVMTSCKSLRNLTSKQSSTETAKTVRSTQKREFLNGIEVTPGYKEKQKTVYVENTVKVETPAKKSNSKKESSSESYVQGDIEKANPLQIKYAIATDATVEKLTNIPLLELIDKWWGTRYCMGGITDSCIDCSAFTQIVQQQVYQLDLKRTAQEQYVQTDRVELEDLHEGDLVFFNTGGKDISHVGIYLLNNKFVHAATSGGVMISDLNDKYWQPKYRGAGRVNK